MACVSESGHGHFKGLAMGSDPAISGLPKLNALGCLSYEDNHKQPRAEHCRAFQRARRDSIHFTHSCSVSALSIPGKEEE